MNFPIALEAYVEIEETDELTPDRMLAREIVRNEIEAKQFLKRFAKSKIVTKPLSPDELNSIT